ncbi:uncharacterized protein PV07_01227 [Cladophialophora immunda]|uniref:NADP-dependent oxidoreductase domain-containing protein n=1 Tax=Cladophialophora immunda TaxID=569365 RepID=A0A0D2DFH7_9EURO|nr:uncharacterized protein PV07_01227 [Cladophialophora immunda]KIW34449.1 hypothetical protein PV07_01227 [Cladophialophora immunda]OQV06973.1 hypothetical protein CLAIMM_11469 [Cladophialophora immunda]
MSLAQIPLRTLGRDGPKVPALGFGLMGLSGTYGKTGNDEERFQILDRALELGETFWDTSDFYGDSEVLLGKWFRRTGKRNEIFLASKFGISPTDFAVDSSAKHYYAHRVNPDIPVEVTVRALAALQAEGKIKHIGLSEISSSTLRRAHKIAPISAVQAEYSLFARDVEDSSGTDLLKTCRELGVALVAYSPLGRGILGGAITTKTNLPANDMRAAYIPWYNKENLDENSKIVDQIKAVAEKKGFSGSQLAIAWLLKQGPEVIPIPGTKKIEYLEENWDSLKVMLTDAEEKEIRRLAESVKGERSIDIGPAHAFANTVEES